VSVFDWSADVLFKILSSDSVLTLLTVRPMRDDAGLRGKVELEASGGINLDTVRGVAETGVDRIAVGAITHSATALDLGLDFIE